MLERHETVAMEELLAQSSWLRRLAVTLVAGEAAAEDLVQETWLVALRHPPLGGRSPRPWLARIARNLAANFRRADARRGERESGAPPGEPPLDPAALAGEIDAQRVLAEAVLRLDEPLRSAVVLRYLRGLDSYAIGRLQGVPDGTVRWRLKRALELLRADLDRQSGGDRRAWCTAFAALVPRHFETTAGGAGLAGVLMSTATKIGIALAAAALVTAWVLVEHDRRPARATEEARLPLADAPPPPDDPLTSREPRVPRETLAPAPAPLAEPVTRECCVVGRVLDPAGRGLPGARVVARVPRLDGTTLRSEAGEDPISPETTSGEDGLYALELAGARPFVLSASHPDHAPVACGPVFAGERRDLALTAGTVLAISVSITAAGARVPGPGAEVDVRIESPERSGELWAASGTTDASGSVEFAGLPAGEARVEARSERGVGRRKIATDGIGSATCAIELALAAGRLDGTVVDRDTALPVAGARVGSPYHGIEEVLTDALGRFALAEIELGEGLWTLGVHAPGYAALFELVRLAPDDEHRTLTFELERAVRVSGRVVDPARRPVALARVLFIGSIPVEPFSGDYDRVRAETDAAGCFAVELHPRIAYRVLVRAAGHGLGLSACGPIRGGSAPVELDDLVLEAAASIAGEIADVPNPAKPCFVRLQWAGDRSPSPLTSHFAHVETTRADARLRFAFDGLGPGRYRLELVQPGSPEYSGMLGAPAEALVELAPGEARRGVVLGARAPALEGTVVDASGAVLGMCSVTLVALAAPEIVVASTKSDGRGRFRLHPHAEGPFRIVVEDSTLFHESRTLEAVEIGDELTIELAAFTSPYSVRGVLIAQNGALPENIYVSFRDARTQERLGRVAIPDLDGAFTMENLRDVPYDLELVDFAGLFEPVRLDGVRPGGEEVELRLVPRR